MKFALKKNYSKNFMPKNTDLRKIFNTIFSFEYKKKRRKLMGKQC